MDTSTSTPPSTYRTKPIIPEEINERPVSTEISDASPLMNGFKRMLLLLSLLLLVVTKTIVVREQA